MDNCMDDVLLTDTETMPNTDKKRCGNWFVFYLICAMYVLVFCEMCGS